MNKAADSTTNPHKPEPSVLGTILTDLADTAWRIAVPVLLFAGIGIVIDKKIGSAPWVTLAGLMIGFVFAGLLIKRQLAAINQREQ